MLWKRLARDLERRATPLSVARFIWSLEGLCQLHKITFDRELLLGQFPGPHTVLTLIDALTRFEAKCGLREAAASDAVHWPLPCLVFLRSPPSDLPSHATTADALQPALLLGADAERVLLFRQTDAAPVTLSAADFATRFAGQVLLVSAKTEGVTDGENRRHPGAHRSAQYHRGAGTARDRMNQQFMLGARNQAFLTEYIAGMETLKSLQMEPQLKHRFGEMLATYMNAGFKTRQLGNTYSTLANLLERLMTLAILCYGAYLVMQNTAFTIGMLVAFQMFAGRLSQPILRLVGLWQQFQQASIAVQRLGDLMNAPAEPYTVIPQRAKNVDLEPSHRIAMTV